MPGIDVGVGDRYEAGADLREFGAVGNGTTDDTAAVTAAFNSGKPITATGGTYLISSVTITTDNTEIDLRGATLKMKASTGNPAAMLIQECQNLVIRNTKFDGNKSGVTSGTFSDAFDNGTAGRSYGAAILNDSTGTTYDGLTVEGCTFTNTFGAAVCAKDASEITVRGCFASGCNFETLYAIGPDNEIENVELSHCRILNTGSGDGSVNGNASIFTNCKNLRIIGNSVDTVERNAWKVGSNGDTITNAMIANNVVRNVTVATFGGMQIQDNTINCTVANNVFADCDTGINIEETNTSHTNLLITDNVFDCTGTGSTGDGIRVSAQLTGAIIARNQIKDFNRYGIRLQSPTDSSSTTRVCINDNVISSANAELAIYLQATTADLNYEVCRNHIYGMEAVSSLGRIRLEVDASDTYFHNAVRFIDNIVEEDATTRRSFWCAEPGAYSGDCVFAGNFFGGIARLSADGNQDELKVRWSNTNKVLGSPVIPGVLRITDGDATPTMRYGDIHKTENTTPTTITALDDGRQGDVKTIFIGDGNTTIDFTGTTLTGNGGADWSPANGDAMRCTFDGTNWRCQIIDCTA